MKYMPKYCMQEPYYIGSKTYYFELWENGLSFKLKQEELISWFYLGDWVNNMGDQDIQAISGTPTLAGRVGIYAYIT